jgi:predicted RecB family nuclease
MSEQFSGVIMVWSHFEANVIRDMSELFPDLSERLTTLLDRTVDLLHIVRDHVAHPDFRGSYSMKAVAPALAPEVTYGDLEIADGSEASAAFYRMVADPTLAPQARDGLRQSLLKYCQRDTLALARVHQWLLQGVAAVPEDTASLGARPPNDMQEDKIRRRSDVMPFDLADIPVLQTGRMGSNYKRRN